MGRRKASLPPTAPHLHREKWPCHKGWLCAGVQWHPHFAYIPPWLSEALSIKTGMLSLAFKASTAQHARPLGPPSPPSGTIISSFVELPLAPRKHQLFLSLSLHILFSLLGMLSSYFFPLANFYSSFKTQAQCLLICSAFAASPRQLPVLTPTFQEVSPHLTKEAWTRRLWPASRGH